MGPPSHSSPEVDHILATTNGNSPQHVGQAASAINASQGPKVVQTAFIHKLYSMLEDKSIQHLISWSNNGDSFVMSPSNEFSKVLAQYFKHTNISSFVRQLNMYGFHKVSDVFHTGSAESALWEFRHGNGSFKKGDLMGLREIKRRASRHTLIHRESFSAPIPIKSGLSQPGTPAEPVQDVEQRLTSLEAMLYEVHARLGRSEDNYSILSARCHTLVENIAKCHTWIHQLSSTVHSALPPDVSLRQDLLSLQKEVERQQELLRHYDQQDLTPTHTRQGLYPSGMALDGPLSPRGFAFDSRRSSMQMDPPPFVSRPPVPPLPPQFNNSSYRFDPVGANQTSPGFSRPQLPTPTPPHPLSNVQSPPSSMARRHTSADIREHGWPLPNPNASNSPCESGSNSVHWQPSSPSQAGPTVAGDDSLHNQLASYQINGSRRPTVIALEHDPVPPNQAETLPPPSSGTGVNNTTWGMGASKFPRPGFELNSAPATRRSSMVHALLNPPVEDRDGEDEAMSDDRKRKRKM